jgi:hypothetical protein
VKIFHSYGSKERLFEMVQRVNNVVLTEGNEDIKDFLNTVRADYPNDDATYTKFLNLAKRKGVEAARQEYDTVSSPVAIKNKAAAERQQQKTATNLEKHNQLLKQYGGVIQLIQQLMTTNGLYDLLLSIMQQGNPSDKLIKMVANKKYANYFNREVKDMVSFQRKYLRSERDLIPLESVELMEYKPQGWEKQYGEKFGLTLKVASYVTAGAFMGKNIDAEDFLYYNVFLDPDLESHIFNTSMSQNKNYGAEYKFNQFEKLASKYNRRMLNIKEFSQFLQEFLNVYNKPDKFYHEKILAKLNEQLLPVEKKNEIVKELLKFIDKKIDLNGDVPEVELSYDENEAKEMKSFGKYVPGTKQLRVVAANRNLADVLRTISHELIHDKQNKNGVLDQNSSETGSKYENEANALAGVIMREFGKIHPEIFE